MKNKIILPDGAEKFSVFRVMDFALRYPTTSPDIFFNPQSTCHTSEDFCNSGERWVEVYINSKEERKWLEGFFRQKGFKTKKLPCCPRDSEKRVWIDPSSYISSQEDLMWDSNINPGACRIRIRIYRKDFETFLDSLKELSEIHKYKTFYWDRYPYYREMYNIRIL